MLRQPLLNGQPLVRDKDGIGSHPALPDFDESTKCADFFAALGIELKGGMEAGKVAQRVSCGTEGRCSGDVKITIEAQRDRRYGEAFLAFHGPRRTLWPAGCRLDQ